MATKAEERKALEQIRKIVNGLGEDSYLAMAFDGCFDDAEANIEEDAAYSYKDRYATALAAYNKVMEESKMKRDTNEEYQKLYTDLKERYNDLSKKFSENVDECITLGQQNKEKDYEIMRLKAKLYDFLIKEDDKNTI